MKRSTLSLLLYTARTLLEQASCQYDNGDDQATDDTLGMLGKVLRFEPEEDAPEPTREVLDEVTRPRPCAWHDCVALAVEGESVCAVHLEEMPGHQRKPASPAAERAHARRRKKSAAVVAPVVEPTVPLDRHGEPVFDFDHNDDEEEK